MNNQQKRPYLQGHPLAIRGKVVNVNPKTSKNGKTSIEVTVDDGKSKPLLFRFGGNKEQLAQGVQAGDDVFIRGEVGAFEWNGIWLQGVDGLELTPFGQKRATAEQGRTPGEDDDDSVPFA